MTFSSGFKQYYQQIINGDVLVLSTFPPKAGWSTGLAMARNSIIYGLANEIYVAESSEKGGTWSGVVDGLRKGRKIYVRKPELTERNANNILIQKGAVPVDFNGNELSKTYKTYDTVKASQIAVVQEPNKEFKTLDRKIHHALSERPLLTRELLIKLELDWTPNKLSNYLIKLDFVEKTKIKGNKNLYKLKGETKQEIQGSLF
jgi:predicted Rossmann fold nucleotide-binding protein DprA/Smf involved in DNA uptake